MEYFASFATINVRPTVTNYPLSTVLDRGGGGGGRRLFTCMSYYFSRFSIFHKQKGVQVVRVGLILKVGNDAEYSMKT